jgi:hypothetical protein
MYLCVCVCVCVCVCLCMFMHMEITIRLFCPAATYPCSSIHLHVDVGGQTFYKALLLYIYENFVILSFCTHETF